MRIIQGIRPMTAMAAKRTCNNNGGRQPQHCNQMHPESGDGAQNADQSAPAADRCSEVIATTSGIHISHQRESCRG